MAYFTVLSQYLSGETEKSHCWLKFELNTSLERYYFINLHGFNMLQ